MLIRIKEWLLNQKTGKYDYGRVLILATALYFSLVGLLAVYMRFDTSSEAAAHQAFDAALQKALEKTRGNNGRLSR